MINREGKLVRVREHTTLHAGDDVLTLTDSGNNLEYLFVSPVDPDHQ